MNCFKNNLGWTASEWDIENEVSDPVTLVQADIDKLDACYELHKANFEELEGEAVDDFALISFDLYIADLSGAEAACSKGKCNYRHGHSHLSYDF